MAVAETATFSRADRGTRCGRRRTKGKATGAGGPSEKTVGRGDAAGNERIGRSQQVVPRAVPVHAARGVAPCQPKLARASVGLRRRRVWTYARQIIRARQVCAKRS